MMADQPDRIVADPSAFAKPDMQARRNRAFGILAIAMVAAALIWGVWYMLTQAGRVSTDNAYVGADTAQVTPLIAAPVFDVRVANTQTVKKGDVLVVLDPSDARIEVAQAEAALAQAEQRYAQSRANVGAAQGRVEARGSEIEQARARLRDADATLRRTQIELRRREALIASGAVSGDELTQARTAYQSALAARELARAGVESAQATQAAATGELEATAALVQGTTRATAPEIAAARARLAAARLNLERTVIRAPIDGVVTNKQVQVGQRVAAGTPIMIIVPTASAFVDANFKEDQLARVRPGQPVKLTSDFYGDDIEFRGEVVGFAGGTGAAFSLIPAQNATGNWIKVVQRLPVRIRLDPTQLKEHPLRVGLSMDVTVDTRDR
jgi:membrane fusion protein, multidrug efflux system